MLADFYSAVLPRQGNLTLFLMGSKQHVWVDSVEDLVEQTLEREALQGVYFATASYIEPTKRTQANVLTLRSLRLDIDAGAKKHDKNPDGTYPTQRDALVALMAFIKTTGIAPTYIVSSGEGLHVYYCLDDDLYPAEWTPLATRLGQLCVEHGLKADSTVTCDTARILRPPGTLHPNGSRVKILKDTGVIHNALALQDKLGVAPAPVDDFPTPLRKYDMSVNADVASVTGPPKSVHKIIANCPAMAEAAAARGDIPEPYWRAMLGIVKFTVEGEDAAHELSSGHDEYDPDATQRKLDAWQTGPTSCAEFGRQTKACEGCQYKGKIKSPITLGQMTVEQIEKLPEEQQAAIIDAAIPKDGAAEPTGMPWDGQLPEKFSVQKMKDGWVMIHSMQVEKESDTGEMVPMVVNVPFTRDIIWLGQWAEATHSSDTAQVTVHRYDRKTHDVKSFLMDQSLAASRFDMMKWLFGKGIGTTSHKKAQPAMEEYIRASLDRIKGLSKRPKIMDRFGIRVMSDGSLASAHGDKFINADGTIQEGMLGDSLREEAKLFELALPESPTGDWGSEVWPEINARAEKYSKFMSASYGAPGAEKFALAAMLALASPLMPFVTGSYRRGMALPPNGLSVSLYSRFGGKGKTGLAQAVMLAYGSPALAKDGGANGSTDLARISKLSMWGTMPLSLEEMGNTREASVANLISSIANGSGRQRATKSGGLTSSATWSLVALITTNRAQRDMVAATTAESSAIQYRLLELDVEQVAFTDEQRAAYSAGWSDVQRDCAGAMGAVIQRLICERGADRLNAEVMAYVQKASDLLGAKQDARFQYRSLGAMLYLQVLLTKAGLAMFDSRTLIGTFKEAFEGGVTYVEENIMPTSGTELLAMALVDLKPHTLITTNETNRGVTPNQYDAVLNSRMPDVVHARHIQSQGLTYVSGHALREWANEKKISEREMLADCKKANVLLPPNKSYPTRLSNQMDLFKGTKETTGSRGSVYKVDVRKLNTLVGGGLEEGLAADNVVPLIRPAHVEEAGEASEATA